MSLALGCSLEDHPSLGKYEAAPAGPLANDEAKIGSDVLPGTDTGSGATALPPIPTAADSGTTHPITGSFDAGPDFQPGADAGPIDAGMAALHCAGVYRGDFTCTISLSLTQPVAMVPITMTIEQSQGSSVAVAKGNVAFDFVGFAFAADLSGQLDCETNAFHAELINGVFAAAVAPIPGPFSGMIDGDRDETMRTMSGSWSFVAPSGESCEGPWSARLQ